jgi:hypothetical protein
MYLRDCFGLGSKKAGKAKKQKSKAAKKQKSREAKKQGKKKKQRSKEAGKSNKQRSKKKEILEKQKSKEAGRSRKANDQGNRNPRTIPKAENNNHISMYFPNKSLSHSIPLFSQNVSPFIR